MHLHKIQLKNHFVSLAITQTNCLASLNVGQVNAIAFQLVVMMEHTCVMVLMTA